MNIIITILVAVLLSTSLWSQAPQSFSYQAVVRGAKNELLVNKPVGMRLSLLQGSEKGKAVYEETQFVNTNENGLISIAIGAGFSYDQKFTNIDWINGPYFLKTETDPTGGDNFTIISISQLLSVPYALTSNNGISRVSVTGDSLVLTNGKTIIIPGISAANPKSNPTSSYGPNISDVDGNSYKTVYIGTQHWMAENLKVTKYNDGTALSNISNLEQLTTLKIPAWCYYNYDVSNNLNFGKLYNYYTISLSNKNVCPAGWHIPLDAEWRVLINFLGGQSVAFDKLKESGNTNWLEKNSASNSTLFTALPGGMINVNGFGGKNYYGNWWTATVINNNFNFWVYSISANSIMNLDNGVKDSGYSIRCLKD